MVKARSRVQSRGLLICTLIPLAFLLIFYIFPILVTFIYSFWKLDFNGQLYPAWSLDNYRAFFTERTYWFLLLKSLRIAALNTVLCILIGYPTAYFIARMVKPKWRYLMMFLAIAPAWTSSLIRTYSWMLVLGDNGVLNQTLMAIGAIIEPIKLMFTSKAVTISLLQIYLPYMILPIFVSIEKTDLRLLDAAESLGATGLQSFMRVDLPLSLPGVVSGSIIVMIPSIGEYVVPMLLGGSTGMMYSNAVSTNFLIMNWPFGAALAFILLIVIMIIFVLYSRIMNIENLWSSL